MAGITLLSPLLPPLEPSLGYDSQPEPTNPMNTTRPHEDFRKLELLDPGGFVH